MIKIDINRRNFIKKSAAMFTAGAAPYLVPSSALGLDGHISASNRITLGVIGAGNQGFQDMKGFLQNDDLQTQRTTCRSRSAS